MAIEQWGWSDRQSSEDELLIAAALNNTLELYPESEIHGTGACRVILTTQSGKLIGGDPKKRFPLTLDLAKKISRYCGRTDGKWDNRWRFDEYPGNQVEGFYDVSTPWVNDNVRDMRWQANLISAEYADTKTLFYPAFQTSYNRDNSVFNNMFVVMAATQIEKIAFKVWTKLVGNSRLKGKAFTDKSDDLITQLVEGLFDNRFRIISKTHFTEQDVESEFAWSTEITIYSNMMKTYNNVTISGKYEDFI